MNRFLAVVVKEFRQLKRDPLSVGVLVLIPAGLLVLYGYALSFDVQNIRTAVLDLDRTPASRSLLDALFENPYFEHTLDFERVEEADGLLARGDVQLVLIVPNDYARKLSRGEDARIQALTDGSDATTASTVIGYLNALSLKESSRLRAAARMKTAPSAPTVVPQPRIWFNPELQSARFLVPGLIGMLLMISAVVATSLSIVREKEQETVEQMKVSPLRPIELILAKIVPYVIICIVTTVLVLALGYWLFGVAVQGSFLLLALATLLFLAAALGMGLLISSVTNSQQIAYQLATLTSLLPSILLSGFIFPIKNMPPAIQAITTIIAPRYYVAALRKIILKGAPFSAVWHDLLPLVALALVFNLLAARGVRRVL
jgi:ABC-2 type transport system permease protein